MSDTDAPCKACRGLDVKFKTTHYGMGQFRTWSQDIAETSKAGCQLCQIIWTGLLHYAKEHKFDDLFHAFCKIDISLPSGEHPLTVYAWDSEGSLDVEFFTLPGIALITIVRGIGLC